ncbi:MAG TPA: VOC family protein [Planctomycetota bacterium]|jgi:catechol 2,3-dioxygenase-like lactoylglutathione lyase family enzyme
MAETTTPKVNIRFLYSYCNDLEATRRFYTECLGMQEQSYANDKEFGWINYKCDGLEYMFFRVDDQTLPMPQGFAAQPGGGGGARPVPSWSIQVPESAYEQTIGNLQMAGFPSNQRHPLWLQDSYWGYVVMDPAGNTVEVFCSPKQRPEKTIWPGALA